MKINKKMITLATVIFSISTLWAGKKLFISKYKWIEIEMISMAGSWWWQSTAPPVWLGNNLKIGATEKDFMGKDVAKILEIAQWPVPSNNSGTLRNFTAEKFLIKAKIKVSQNPSSGKYSFGQNPIAIGQPIALEINNTLLNGNIVWVEGQPKAKRKRAQVQLIIRNRRPYFGQIINSQDTLKINNQEVFKIISKKTTPASDKQIKIEKESLIHNLELIDILITAEIQIEIYNQQPVFLKEQSVKVGKSLFIPLSNYDLSSAEITKIKWLN